MIINEIIVRINEFLWGWPLVIFVAIAALITTVVLGFVQFRYFFTGWKLIFTPGSIKKGSAGDMTPFQAFINTLSASLGNGSLAGMSVAVYSGGPGAALWMFILGLLAMSLRFSEVFLSTVFGVRHLSEGTIGGPMVYLAKVPGKTYLPFLYAFLCLLFSLIGGNAAQANSIRLGIARISGFDAWIISIILLFFVIYVMFGGAKRIIAISTLIIPIKVGIFFLSAITILLYHYQQLLPGLKLIIQMGLAPQAIIAGATGFTVQQAMRFGMSRSLYASEAGLGTAGILFGGSGSKEPVKDGILAMLGAFISSNLVCCSIILMLVVSGVWNNGETSINLTISAYETVFGRYGGWFVTFLTLSFGLGVMVAYAYIARSCWLFLTGGRWMMFFTLLYCVTTFLGSMAKIDVVWNAADVIEAGLLLMNLFAILMLLPIIKKGLIEYRSKT